MPRISSERTDARRRHIIDAARTCFLRDGFHNTSMQDILREGNLSAGAFYIYFKSKEEIIAAIASETIEAITAVFADVADLDEPPGMDILLDQVLSRATAADVEFHVFSIATQVWAESLRSPLLAGLLAIEYEKARQGLAELIVVYQARGLIGDDVTPQELASVVLTLIQGFILQHVVFNALEAKTFRAGLMTLMADHKVTVHQSGSDSE